MTLLAFINEFNDQFDVPQELQADTQFKKLKTWDSMTALLIITMIEEEYGIPINGDDIRRVETIGEMHSLVLEKMSRFQKI